MVIANAIYHPARLALGCRDWLYRGAMLPGHKRRHRADRCGTDRYGIDVHHGNSRFVIVADERVARFVGERVGCVIYPPFTTLGIERDGAVIAGAVFNCYDGPNVHITVAGKGWSRTFLELVGQYVFDQLGCCRCTFITEQDCVARLAERLGGKAEGVMRDCFGPGRDGTIIGVLRKEWVWDRLMERGC